MATPLLLALALMQAPTSAPAEPQVVAPDAAPTVAKGIEVLRVEEAPQESGAGVQVVGVAPLMNPCSWSERCLYSNWEFGLGVGDYRDKLFFWKLRAAENKEVMDRQRGYHALAVERARMAGGSSGPRPQPPPPATTSSGFSGGMYVGKTPTTGASATVPTGKPGGKI